MITLTKLKFSTLIEVYNIQHSILKIICGGTWLQSESGQISGKRDNIFELSAPNQI